MQQSFETPTPPSSTSQASASAETKELVMRLTMASATGDDAMVKSVAEATGRSADVVRAELAVIRLEHRVKELETRPVQPTQAVRGNQGGFVGLMLGLRDAGPGGVAVMVFIGLAIMFVGIGLMVAIMQG